MYLRISVAGISSAAEQSPARARLLFKTGIGHDCGAFFRLNGEIFDYTARVLRQTIDKNAAGMIYFAQRI